jgi:hypothetical protein
MSEPNPEQSETLKPRHELGEGRSISIIISLTKIMPGALLQVHSVIPRLLAPTHRYLPYGVIDLYGASRLSLIIDWVASGAFDSPTPKEKGKKKAKNIKERATLLQELFGLMVVVFGGETFLGEIWRVSVE